MSTVSEFTFQDGLSASTLPTTDATSIAASAASADAPVRRASRQRLMYDVRRFTSNDFPGTKSVDPAQNAAAGQDYFFSNDQRGFRKLAAFMLLDALLVLRSPVKPTATPAEVAEYNAQLQWVQGSPARLEFDDCMKVLGFYEHTHYFRDRFQSDPESLVSAFKQLATFINHVPETEALADVTISLRNTP